ncbi:hypothetical protein NB491_09785 [Vibrio alginolyticus]|uniref:hypothetical protein n=1 Tax=Vibrio harveyi group TaxID=717610 RepID=UPI00215C7DE9|nr:hypothetical protein [Vibrio alginolyticus]MCR9636265.1 hypothetical protein [Vibrio alginolyticus]
MNVVVDLIRKENEHHVFNSEMVKYFDSCGECLFYLDEKSSSISNIKEDSKVKKIHVKCSQAYFWVFSNLLLFSILIKNGREKHYAFLSATPLQYILLSIISKLFRVKVSIFMHGELGYLKEANGFGQSIGSKFIDLAFNLTSRVNFIAINAFIYDNLVDLYPSTKFLHIEHPIQDSPNVRLKNLRDKKNIFGAFGIQSSNKRSEKIYEISSLLPDEFFSNNILTTVGVSDESFSYDLNERVEHRCRGTLKECLIPFDEFMANVKDIDFVLFFSENDSRYELTPSGVFSDCIALNKPIIAIKTSMLISYFEKYGELGYLCENIEDMVEKIINIAQEEECLKTIKLNLDGVKTKLSKDYYVEKINAL